MSKESKEQESKFTGGLFMHMVTQAAVFAAVMFTAGLLLPFAMCFRERWSARNTIINGRRLEFYGSPIILFLRKLFFLLFGPALVALAVSLLVWVLPAGDGSGVSVLGWSLVPTLTALGFAIFMAWLSLRMQKWITRHTRFCKEDT